MNLGYFSGLRDYKQKSKHCDRKTARPVMATANQRLPITTAKYCACLTAKNTGLRSRRGKTGF